MFLKLTSFLVLSLFIVCGLQAQTQPAASATNQVMGEVTAINAASGQISIKTDIVKSPPMWLRKTPQLSIAVGWTAVFTGINGPASTKVIWTLTFFFLKAGAFVFGSGLAIVPFLYGGVVSQFHWLTERQFVDAIAVPMITPGPVVITAAFIGFLVAGFMGGALAAAAVFAPPFLIVVTVAPYYRRVARNPQVKAFVQGVTAAAVGAIAGAVVILALRSIVDWVTVAIALAVLAVLLKARKVPEPLLIAAAGILGLLLHRSGT